MPSVWIFNHYAGFPEKVPATRTFELASRLVSLGWNVTVVACSFNHFSFSDDFPDVDGAVHETERDGVRWVFIKSSPYRHNGLARLRNMRLYSRRAERWGRRQGSGPDVIIGSTLHPLAAESARRVARRHDAVHCYEIADLWPETLVDLGAISRRSFAYRHLFRLERRSLSDAAGVIGLLPRIPDYAEELHGLTLSRFRYVPNGAATSVVDEGPQEGEPVPGQIAYAGGFAQAHGLGSVVDAAEILLREHGDRFTVHFYGDGVERAPLEASAAARGLTNLTFHGLIPKAEIGARLRAAEICLCTGEPMSVHRFGVSFNKLFDYFDAGRPIVFAVDSGNDPVAQAGAGRSVAAGDARALADAIVELSDLGPRALADMGTAGKEFLRREHDFDVLSARLDQFLRSLV
jgi:glycosyltransferase involved in cell wall biosynthesis